MKFFMDNLLLRLDKWSNALQDAAKMQNIAIKQLKKDLEILEQELSKSAKELNS